MTLNPKIPVLDDCNFDAVIIGAAASAEEAADVYVAHFQRDNPDESIERPEFQLCVKKNSPARGNVEDEYFFEPIF